MFKNHSILLIIVSCLFSLSNCIAQDNRLWATYYGGTGEDLGYCVVTDVFGNTYISGYTTSTYGISYGGFQNAYGGGSSDAFLVKFDPSGNRLWATYYGGGGGENGVSVATDASGNVFMSGYTTSTTGIASGGFQNAYGGGLVGGDAFLVKFNPSGTRIWATYYGGNGDDQGYGIAIDVLGNVYLTGYTISTNGIASGGFQNNHVYGTGGTAFLVKFDGLGNRLWATYYGGTDDTYPLNLATDALGNVFIAGHTNCTSDIASGGFQNSYGGGFHDAFLVKFDATGNRLWATYYGGLLWDDGFSVAADLSGNVYLVGQTESPSDIAYGGFQNVYGGGTHDDFLVKFDASGNRLWATYYGGTGDEKGLSVAIDTSSGNVYISGVTYSTTNIASSGFQNILTPAMDCFVAKFDTAGNRVCATYYGNTGNQDADGRVAIDISGNVYLSGSTSNSSGIASGGFQNYFGGGVGNDAFLVKFTGCCTSPPNASITGSSTICDGQVTTLTATGLGSYSWNTGEATPIISVSPSVTTSYAAIVTNGCGSDTAIYTVSVTTLPIATFSFSSSSYCQNGFNPFPTFTGGAISGIFTSSAGLSVNANTGELNLSNSLPGTYTITNTIESPPCSAVAATAIITITAFPATTFSYAENLYCQSENDPSPTYSNGGVAGAFTSTTGLSIDANTGQIDLSASTSGNYTVTNTIAATGGCPTVVSTESITLSAPTANAGTDVTINASTSTQLNAIGSGTYNWTPSESLSCISCQNPIATPLQTTTYTVAVTDTNGCTATDDITVTIDCGEVSVPSAFSPNNDNANELECVFGKCIESMTFIIFDRWGEKVFETANQNQCWDGTSKGKPVNSDVFVYYLKVTFLTGQKIIRQGNISLIR